MALGSELEPDQSKLQKATNRVMAGLKVMRELTSNSPNRKSSISEIGQDILESIELSSPQVKEKHSN